MPINGFMGVFVICCMFDGLSGLYVEHEGKNERLYRFHCTAHEMLRPKSCWILRENDPIRRTTKFTRIDGVQFGFCNNFLLNAIYDLWCPLRT